MPAWSVRLLRCSLLLGIGVFLALSFASTPLAGQTDVIRGRVTDVDGQAVPGVSVTATSIPGNVTRSATTNAQGIYQIAFPGGPGDYIMGFAHAGYGFRQFQLKRLADEELLVADARLAPVQLDEVLVLATRAEPVPRNSPTPDVGGTEVVIPPDVLPVELLGDLAAMAASLPGVLLLPGIDGEPDGFSVLGLDADQNSVTLNGLETGAANLPRDAAVSSALVTSPFDVSRGGFSGANLNIRSRAGSNFETRGTSLVSTAPQVQWTDRAGQAVGSDYTNVSLGGTASGPIRRNKAFYNVSLQLGRQSRENRTLLSTSPLGLQTAGVAADSVARFVGVLDGLGVPGVGDAVRPSRVSDNGSLFASFDVAPPAAASGQAYTFTVDGNWRRQAPVAGGPSALALGSAAGDRTSWGGGVQAKQTRYLGRILSETAAGLNLSREYAEPYLELPAGRVRVSSTLEGGRSGVQNLTFGGHQGLGSSSRSTTATVQNHLSWFDHGNRHRLRLTTELQFRGRTQEQASNLLGSFSFNSLEELQAGRPASFSRSLSVRQRSTGQLLGSVALGDSYRRSPDLQFQYGVRVDASRFTTAPAYNPLVEALYGRRNDVVPASLVVSPRLGFSWTVGSAPEVASFAGAARVPRAVIRGGVGVFASNPGAGQIGAALDNTGLPSGAQQLMCVGPAVPVPDWSAYAADPASIPEHCADGTTGPTVFSSPAPNVTLFAPDFRAPRTVRSNLSWSGAVLDARFSLNVEGTYSLNLSQQRLVDLNFSPAQRFTLADDGRPVYVERSSIVPGTGAVASRDARRAQDFARVSEVRSDLESRTAQLRMRLSPRPRGPTRFGWNAAYTYTHVREQVSGFTSTAGDPLAVEWARAAQGPHQINYTLRYNFFDAVQVSWNGWFRSGSAFTPGVAGDVNGDGYSNDRAYVPSPTGGGDPALAEGIARLLESAPGSTRACLERQMGRIAERNSCRGPWTSSASMNVTLDRARFRMPRRGAVSFSVSNPLGAADLLLNGSGNLKGWGQSLSPDPSLLYVRGFDPQTSQYRYEVNPRFGATRPQLMALRSPVTLTASVRVDLGPSRERQNLGQQLRRGRTEPGTLYPESLLRSQATGGVSNPMATILRQQDTLRLTAFQPDSIASMNRRYTYQVDSLWTPVTRQLAALPADYDEPAAYEQFLRARHAQVAMLARIGPAIRELLTPEQRRRLPASVVNLLDPRYLALIRDGTPMYLSGAGTVVAPAGAPLGVESIVIIR